MRNKNEDMLRVLAEELDKLNNGKSKRATLPTINMSKLSTGIANKYQFGFMTRNINLSRGGKEGNNAFSHD